MTGLVKLWYWNVEARPQRLRELKGPEGQAGRNGSVSRKKRKTLSNEVGPAEKNPLLAPSLCLLTCLACCSSSTERFFSDSPPPHCRQETS